jgi:hypothetical protein
MDGYYDKTSPNGDLLCDMSELKHNLMLPENPVGFFIYKSTGGAYDKIEENHYNELINLTPLKCDPSYLELFGLGKKLKRKAEWSDEEYRALILLNYIDITTIKGLENYFKALVDTQENSQNDKVNLTLLDSGFKYSDETEDNHLCSDETEYIVLIQEVGIIIIVDLPSSISNELFEFIAQYLGYNIQRAG